MTSRGRKPGDGRARRPQARPAIPPARRLPPEPPSGGPPYGPARRGRDWGSALIALVMVTWVLSYTPHPIALFAVPGIVGWLALVERCRLRRILLWTTLFGAVATSIGYRWLAPTIQLFGGVSPALSWVAVALFGVWNTIHGWVFAAFYRGMLRRGRRPHPFVTAALFAGCEALPIRMFGWSSGHGMVDVPPLVQSAEWGGVVGVSFVVCLLVVPVHEWLRWAFVRRGPPARARAALATFLLGLAFFGWGLWRYREVHREEAEASRHLRVAIVQADVGSLDKRRATEEGGAWRDESLAAYREATMQAVAKDPDVIVWPETAITDAVPFGDPVQTNRFLGGRGYGFLLDAARRATLLVGVYERVLGRESLATGQRLVDRYNDAGLRAPGGDDAPWSVYRKVHLIPFGETMPLGIMEDRLPQNFKMLAGSLPQPLLESNGVTYAPFLCYEGILADHVREYVAGRRPDVLVSLTNDSWFGDTWEPHQHLAFTRFRAVEHRAPLVRATNTGISAFVDETGDVQSTLGVGASGSLVADVPLVKREPTVYVRLGWRFPYLLWGVALLGWILAQLRPPPFERGD